MHIKGLLQGENKGELNRSRFREGAPDGSGSPSSLLEPSICIKYQSKLGKHKLY